MGCASVLDSSPEVELFVCCRLISKKPRINELNELIAVTHPFLKILPCLEGCSKLAAASWCPFFISSVSWQVPPGKRSFDGEDKDDLHGALN